MPTVSVQRNGITIDGFVLEPIVRSDQLPTDFCDDHDLNDFFKNDYKNYEKQLLAITYKFYFCDFPNKILGLVSLSNDSLKVSSSYKKREIPSDKHHKEYPAIKLLPLQKQSVN